MTRLCNACSLRTTGYPYVALLVFTGTRTKVIAAMEGLSNARQLQAMLQQAVGEHEGHLAVEQADANERVCCCYHLPGMLQLNVKKYLSVGISQTASQTTGKRWAMNAACPNVAYLQGRGSPPCSAGSNYGQEP